MSKKQAKERGMWFDIFLILSYPLILTYLTFLSPSLVRSTYGELSTAMHAYWLTSGVVYVASLIGVTKWKRLATYPLVAVLLGDAVACYMMGDTFSVVMNIAHAAFAVLVLKIHWKKFE